MAEAPDPQPLGGPRHRVLAGVPCARKGTPIVLDGLLTDLAYHLYVAGGPPDRLDLPDFLGIGVPQGATTWLFENLRRHPDVFLPECKELRFFDRKFYRSFEWYQQAFEPAGDRLRGEITPAYCILPEDRVAVLAALLPDVRLVLMLRHPVQRVWSAARRILGLLGARDLSQVTVAELERVLARPGVQARTDYPAILDRWRAHFPADQLLVEFTEDIGRDPVAVLRRVFGHLGVDDDPDWSGFDPGKGVNRNPRRDIPARLEAHLRGRYQGVVGEMRSRFGERLACWDEI